MNRFFHMVVKNWKRKAVSAILASFIWILVDQSLTSTRTLFNIPVRVVHVPSSRTILGIESSGRIQKKMNLTVTGNKTFVDALQANDLEIVLDAADKPIDWPITVTKKNLVSLNPDVDLTTGLNKISHNSFTVHFSKFVTEKIPVVVVAPSGEPPRGYQYLQVRPHRLELSVNGPEEILKKIHQKEIKLSFDLKDLTKKQLDALAQDGPSDQSNLVSFPVPEAWKFCHIPEISDTPIMINDPEVKNLQISFLRYDLLAINGVIPVQFFFSAEELATTNPSNVHIVINDPIKERNGVLILDTPLYAKGADQFFLDIVKNKLLICVEVSRKDEQVLMNWNVQFLCPQALEDEYVRALTLDTIDNDLALVQHSREEEYLRNRFRSYMHRFRLYQQGGSKLILSFQLDEENNLVASMIAPPPSSESPIVQSHSERTYESSAH